MLAEEALDRAAGLIADGEAVDWDAIEETSQTPDDRRRAAALRVVDAVARVHRALPAPELQNPDPEKVWGRYRLTQVVGAGSYGSVYRAFDPELEREVAIKILHRQVADSKLREQLLQEGRALAKVRHAHVVSVFGVESYGNRVGLCMEFVYGDTLEQVLKSHGTMNAREAILVGQDICRALAAVHAAGYVHRDVKARNIMRDHTGRIVLMDFGAGREIEEGGRSGPVTIVGTPPYMAPEVLAGEPASVASDVYSVGVLLYHLVSGKYPVEGTSIEKIKAAHMLAQRTPISERRTDLPPAFVQVVDRAITANPRERWASAGTMLDALTAAIGSSTPRSWWATLAIRTLTTTAAAAAVITFLGWVMSYFFNNLVMGRAQYVQEFPRDWLYWGLISLGSTLALALFTALVLSILLVARRLVIGVSAMARRCDDSVFNTMVRLRMNDVTTAANWALIGSAIVVGFTWWTSVPFIEQLLGIYPDTLSTAPAAKLAFLSSNNVDAHQNYRLWFIWSTIISGALWVPVWWLSTRTHDRISRSVIVGGCLVILFSLLMAAFPYRLLVKGDLETALLRGQQCFIAGERNDDALVFCPAGAPPRSQVVPKTSPDLQRSGVLGDVLTRIDSAK